MTENVGGVDRLTCTTLREACADVSSGLSLDYQVVQSLSYRRFAIAPEASPSRA